MTRVARAPLYQGRQGPELAAGKTAALAGTILPGFDEPAGRAALVRAGEHTSLARTTVAGHKASRFYRPELDALRLVAFLMVWVSHSLPTTAEAGARGLAPSVRWWVETVKDAGNFGVCVFFFLSAYLITELLRRERLAIGSIHLRAFYLRRVLRIWPLYLGVLAVYGLLGLRFHGFRIEPGRLLASVLLAGNWYICLHPAILTPMRALWSLSVEEQFYLGWPVLVRDAGRFGVAIVCAALLLLGQGTLLWMARGPEGEAGRGAMLHITVWVNSLVQFQFFALGSLAALLLAGRIPRIAAWARLGLGLTAAAAMLLAAGVCGIKRAMPWHSPASLAGGYLLVGSGCVLLFMSVFGLSKRSVPRWSVSLGGVSFGLYVFHETGFFFADFLEKHLLRHRFAGLAVFGPSTGQWALALAANKVVALGFTMLLAYGSYRLWERPFLRLKDRFAFVQSRRA